MGVIHFFVPDVWSERTVLRLDDPRAGVRRHFVGAKSAPEPRRGGGTWVALTPLIRIGMSIGCQRAISSHRGEGRARGGAPIAAEVRSQGTNMSVKKEASGRRSVQVEGEVAGGTQSAVARRAAEAEVRTIIAKFAPARLRLIGAMRRCLRKRLPTAHEVVYEYRDWFVISFSPNEHGYEGVLAIRASANGVRLYFNSGKELPDPEKLLQGSGQTRSINVEGASTLARPAITSLID